MEKQKGTKNRKQERNSEEKGEEKGKSFYIFFFKVPEKKK